MEATSAGGLKGHRLNNVGSVIILDPMVASPTATKPQPKASDPIPVVPPRAAAPTAPTPTAPDRPFVPARPAPVPAAVTTPVTPESTSESHFTREAENFRARQATGQLKEGDPKMAGGSDHAHGGGGGGSVSPTAIKILVYAIAGLIAVIAFIRFFDWATGERHYSHQGYYPPAAYQQAPAPAATFAPTALWGHQAPQRPGYGVPSPEQVSGMAQHHRQYIPVPCAHGYTLNPQDGRCYRVRWVPGN